MPYRRNSAAALRFAERRRLESEAPLLSTQVPGLTSLQFAIEERVGVTGTKHLRRFVIDRQPALFLMPCGDPRCVDGGHDLTYDVMRALRARERSFHGSDECTGTVGSSPCGRVVSFEATAEYGPRS